MSSPAGTVGSGRNSHNRSLEARAFSAQKKWHTRARDNCMVRRPDYVAEKLRHAASHVKRTPLMNLSCTWYKMHIRSARDVQCLALGVEYGKPSSNVGKDMQVTQFPSELPSCYSDAPYSCNVVQWCQSSCVCWAAEVSKQAARRVYFR
jgi:hypothetical protein